MPYKIATSFVKGLAANPPDRAKDFRDSSLTGFLVRAYPSGQVSYYAQVGRARRLKIGDHPAITVGEAREAARKVLAALTLDQLPGPRKRPRMRLGDFIQGPYRDWAEANLKRYQDQFDRLNLCWRHLYDRYLDEICRHDIERWSSKKRAHHKPSTINRNVTAIRSVMARATEWEFIEQNPLTGMKFLRVDKQRPPRMLSGAERARFLEAVRDRRDHMRSLILFLYYTGCRRGEAFQLEWADVDFERGLVVIRGDTTKTGSTRTIPLGCELRDELQFWRQFTLVRQLHSGIRSDLVFPGPTGKPLGTVKHAWRSLCRDAEVSDFQLRDLRADACSRLVNGGIPLASAQKLLGHSSPVTTMRHYARIEETALREAVEVL